MLKSVSSIAIFGLVGIYLSGVLLTNADNDVALSLEGLRCDSCGRECSIVCGSRQFRTCCFNYIKKRSDPTLERLSGSQGKHGKRSLPEDNFLQQEIPSLGYILPGQQFYLPDIQDREPILRNLVFAQSRKSSTDI